jgi:hypothetical protein
MQFFTVGMNFSTPQKCIFLAFCLGINSRQFLMFILLTPFLNILKVDNSSKCSVGHLDFCLHYTSTVVQEFSTEEGHFTSG